MDNNIAAAKNMTLQLSNEYQAISVDSDGNYSTFPSGITTKPTVMYGSKDITADCTYTVTKSEGVTGVWNNASKTFTATGLTVDNGWVEIQAVYLQVLAVTKRLVLTKLHAGPKGDKGTGRLQGPKGDQAYRDHKEKKGKPVHKVQKENRELPGHQEQMGGRRICISNTLLSKIQHLRNLLKPQMCILVHIRTLK